MSDRAYCSLVVRYADGRTICNCRQAYADRQGGCEYGCDANRIFARDEIAARVVADLSLVDDPEAKRDA